MQQITKCKTRVVEYESMNEFYKYITTTPINESFKGQHLSSEQGTYSFTDTHSFSEAANLMKNGWKEMANKLTQKLNAIENEVQPSTKSRNIYDVQGFQASTPRYLQGIPTNMIAKKNFPTKQKVITICKDISYSCQISVEQIVNECTKALQIVKKLEAQGYRVNLYLLYSIDASKDFVIKIKLKDSGERLNVSKLAFPMVHPSMLRRLIFKWMETYPEIPTDCVCGYGRPMYIYKKNLLKNICENEYLLPAFIGKDINTLEDLRGL